MLNLLFLKNSIILCYILTLMAHCLLCPLPQYCSSRKLPPELKSLYFKSYFPMFFFFVNDCFTLCVFFVILYARDVISPKFTFGGSSTRENHLPKSSIVWFAPPPSSYEIFNEIRGLDFTLFCSSFSG